MSSLVIRPARFVIKNLGVDVTRDEEDEVERESFRVVGGQMYILWSPIDEGSLLAKQCMQAGISKRRTVATVWKASGEAVDNMGNRQREFLMKNIDDTWSTKDHEEWDRATRISRPIMRALMTMVHLQHGLVRFGLDKISPPKKKCNDMRPLITMLCWKLARLRRADSATWRST